MKTLYTKNDNVELNNVLEEKNLQQTDQGLMQPTVMVDDAEFIESKIQSTSQASVENPQLFEGIKDIFENNTQHSNVQVFFTRHAGMKVFNIDKTIFKPNAIVLLSRKSFEVKYLEQLESYIFNAQENLDTDKLFSLIYLYSYINKNQFPIKITSNQHKKSIELIIKTLNTFFNKNKTVISGIYTMFNSIRETEKEVS